MSFPHSAAVGASHTKTARVKAAVKRELCCYQRVLVYSLFFLSMLYCGMVPVKIVILSLTAWDVPGRSFYASGQLSLRHESRDCWVTLLF